MAYRLDLPTLAMIIDIFCPPKQQLHEIKCLGGTCEPACQCRNEDLARVRALAALCLTSKWVNSLATQHLYHRPAFIKWPLLARTLILRPDLAARVKYLCTRDWDEGPRSSNELYDPPLPPEVRAYREETLRRTGAREDNSDTCENLALLATICPNFEEIDTVLDYDFTFTYSATGSLPRLRTIAVAHSDTEFGVDLGFLDPLGDAAPGLSMVLGWQVASAGGLRTPLRNVTHVRLNWSTLDPECLRTIFHACPRLETFEFGAANATVGFDQFTPLEAQDAIIECVPGLKNLRMNFIEVYEYSDMGDDAWAMRSLAAMTGLERLDLDTCSLVPHRRQDVNVQVVVPGPYEQLVPVNLAPAYQPGEVALVDFLPSSIREVLIRRGYGPDITDLTHTLSNLAAVTSVRFPRLAEVVISGIKGANVEDLGPAFSKAGVEFYVTDGLD